MMYQRLARLESLYLNMVYAMIDEAKEPNPSEAVITACQVAKKVIYREHEAIARVIGADTLQVSHA